MDEHSVGQGLAALGTAGVGAFGQAVDSAEGFDAALIDCAEDTTRSAREAAAAMEALRIANESEGE